ncbi:MAG: protein-L-isoaspartate O-methyltransferase [Burkholderiales bacterium]
MQASTVAPPPRTYSFDSQLSPVEQARFNMIEQQIRPWDVLDGEILHLLSVVRREEFVPPEHRAIAFVDLEIPLSADVEQSMRLGQCMLSPKVEARLLQDLELKPNQRVLEIGAGSGYMAALLGASCERVISLEIDERLAKMASANLQRAGIGNVQVRQADGAHGAPDDGPFDAIVLSGSVAEVPQLLLAQLRVGGRLVAIVGQLPMMRATVVMKSGKDSWQSLQPWDTVAPRLVNFPEPSRFVF